MMPDGQSERFVKLVEVKRRVGLDKSMIYRLIQEERFPPPYKISPSASRWSDQEIVAWSAAMQDDLTSFVIAISIMQPRSKVASHDR